MKNVGRGGVGDADGEGEVDCLCFCEGMSWSFFCEIKVSCVVTLCKRGIEWRATELLYVHAVQVSFLKSVLVELDFVES